MTDRPILFNGAMVRAILDGQKTQTRRAIKPQPANDPARHHPIAPYHNGSGGWNWVLAATGHGTGDPFSCPFGQPGDRLWVRETWAETDRQDGTPVVAYAAGGCTAIGREGTNGPDVLLQNLAWGDTPHVDRWRPSIHMPRWACRLVLEVTDVRVERLQAITAADCWDEGIPHSPDVDPRHDFEELWTNTGGNWTANPWVWVVGFRIAEGQANG